jgi:VWFA-related protein
MARHSFVRKLAATYRQLLFCVLSIIVISFAGGAAAQQPQPAAPIQVHVDRVEAGVIVTDAAGAFVSGLPRTSFHLFDNGAEQRLTDFVDTEAPAQVLLLIEAGPAVYLLGDSHLRAAYALLNGLSAGDSVAIASYAQSPQALLAFTADKRAAAAALDNLRFNLGFGSLNLSSSLDTVLSWLDRVPGKKSVVLLSTGVDTSPPSAVSALQTRLQAGDVRVFAVSLGRQLRGAPPPASRKRKKRAETSAPPATSALSGQFAQADSFLQALADVSGGRAYFPKDAAEFQQDYQQIAQLVRHEYSLAFAPPAPDGQLHKLEVRIDPPPGQSAPGSLRVDSRRAYRAPAAN